MEYIQPVGDVADAPYVDADPANGVDGSIVPAAAIEDTQREIVNVIIQAGLTPSGADLTQLFAAVRQFVDTITTTKYSISVADGVIVLTEQ